MADLASMTEEEKIPYAAKKKARTFKKFSFRGMDLEALLKLDVTVLQHHVRSRIRRRFKNGLGRKPMRLIKRLRKAKRNAGPMEKPEPIKTHLRNMIIVPEMVASVCGVYNGRDYVTVEIKPDMIGHYLGEFSITYHPVAHGRPGLTSGKTAQFIPLK